MTSTSSTGHPLDASDPFADVEVSQSTSPKTNQPLLRWSVRALIVAAVCVFWGGIATGNALPNSTLESVSSIIQRSGMFGMLAAFCAILIAYRTEQIRNFWSALKTTSQELAASTADKKYASRTVLIGLIVANIVFALVLIAARFLLPTLMPLPFDIAGILVIMYAGLLATMIWWHDGFVKAYAIGALTSLILSYLTPVGIMMFQTPRQRSVMPLFISPIVLTMLPLLTGLMCALYVYASKRLQNRSVE